MIFPWIAYDVVKYLFIDISATNIDGKVFILMETFEELGNWVNWVPIKFLKSWCGKGHRDNPGGNIGQIEIIAIFSKPIFGSTHYLSEEVHQQS